MKSFLPPDRPEARNPGVYKEKAERQEARDKRMKEQSQELLQGKNFFTILKSLLGSYIRGE